MEFDGFGGFLGVEEGWHILLVVCRIYEIWGGGWLTGIHGTGSNIVDADATGLEFLAHAAAMVSICIA